MRQLADCWLAEGDKVMALLSVRSVSDLRAGVGLPEDYWPGLVERQAEVLLPWLNEVASAGLEGGAQTVGAKRKGQKDGPELLINWELVNQQAADWAETYGYDLVRGITETTQKQLQAAINAWIESGETFPKLVKRVNGIFDNKRRAKLIAATEATRAYAQANTIAWRDAGAWGREWRTAVDELVCPRCGGLHRQRAELGKAFAGGIDSPPAHPGCRCSLVPVVFEGYYTTKNEQKYTDNRG